MVDDLVDLIAELFVELGDDGLDRRYRVRRDDRGRAEGLLRQREHRRLDLFAGSFRLGLKFFLSRDANSPASTVAVSPPPFTFLLLAHGSLALGFVGFRGRGEGGEQPAVTQHFGDQRFRAGLAVHVSDEIGELRARLEKLLQAGTFLATAPGEKSARFSNAYRR